MIYSSDLTYTAGGALKGPAGFCSTPRALQSSPCVCVYLPFPRQRAGARGEGQAGWLMEGCALPGTLHISAEGKRPCGRKEGAPRDVELDRISSRCQTARNTEESGAR